MEESEDSGESRGRGDVVVQSDIYRGCRAIPKEGSQQEVFARSDEGHPRGEVHLAAGSISEPLAVPKDGGCAEQQRSSWKNVLNDISDVKREEEFFSAKDKASIGVIKENEVVLPPEAISNSRLKWSTTILAQIWNGRVRDDDLIHFLSSNWSRWQPKITTFSHGVVIAELAEARAVDEILAAGPWICKGLIVGLQRWCPRFKPGIRCLRFAPVWIRLHNLPLEFWERSCLFTIVSAIGRPIKLDDVTLSGSRRSFARICVEVDLEIPLVEGIWIDDGMGSFWQAVAYEHVPGLKATCFFCGVAGHRSSQCEKQMKSGYQRKVSDDVKVTKGETMNSEVDKEGWQVQGRKGAATRRIMVESKKDASPQSVLSKPPGFETLLANDTDRGDGMEFATEPTLPGHAIDQRANYNSHKEGNLEEQSSSMDNKREEELIMENFKAKLGAHSERWWNLRGNTSKRQGTPPLQGGFEFGAVEVEEGEILQRTCRSISRDRTNSPAGRKEMYKGRGSSKGSSRKKSMERNQRGRKLDLSRSHLDADSSIMIASKGLKQALKKKDKKGNSCDLEKRWEPP